MTELITLLHEGGYSCVVRNGEDVRTFTKRGVADLFELLTTKPDFLQGSSIADKVIGKGAAALMVKGGVQRVYADVISQSALDLLRNAGVDVSYSDVVAHIINRAGTGMCPVEQRCLPLSEIDDMVAAIRDFIAAMQQ